MPAATTPPQAPSPDLVGSRRSNSAIGLSVLGACAAGVVAMIATIPAWGAGDWVGVGALTGGAGISFGLLANALLRR